MRKLFIVLLSKVEANTQFLICSRDKQRNNRTATMRRVGHGSLNFVSPLTADSPECHWHNGHLTQSRVLSHIYLFIWCESVISRSPPIRTIRPKLIPFRTASAQAAQVAKCSSRWLYLNWLSLRSSFFCFLFLLRRLAMGYLFGSYGLCSSWRGHKIIFIVLVLAGWAILTDDGGDGTAKPNAQQWNLLYLECHLSTYAWFEQRACVCACEFICKRIGIGF